MRKRVTGLVAQGCCVFGPRQSVRCCTSLFLPLHFFCLPRSRVFELRQLVDIRPLLCTVFRSYLLIQLAVVSTLFGAAAITAAGFNFCWHSYDAVLMRSAIEFVAALRAYNPGRQKRELVLCDVVANLESLILQTSDFFSSLT